MSLFWEMLTVKNTGVNYGVRVTQRAKVPGGWLVAVVMGQSEGGGLTFYPDPEHRWDGSSLPAGPVEHSPSR